MEYSTTTVNAVVWSLTAIAFVVVLLRVFARVRLAHIAGADDKAICVALFLDILFSCTLSAAAAHGMGTAERTIAPQEREEAVKLNVAASVIGAAGLFVPKLSVALLLIRVLEPRLQMKALLCTSSVLGICCSLVLAVMTLLQCAPTGAAWIGISSHSCVAPIQLIGFSLFAGVYSAFLDLIYAVYPTVVIFGLRMRLKEKLILSGAFNLILLGAVATILKCSQVAHLADRANITESSVLWLTWTSVETNITIIAASIPTLGPFWRFINSKSSGNGQSTPTNTEDTCETETPTSLAALSGRLSLQHATQTPPFSFDFEQALNGGDAARTIIKTVEVTIQREDATASNSSDTWYSIPPRKHC